MIVPIEVFENKKDGIHWSNERSKIWWHFDHWNHFLATRLVVVGGGSCRESMQGGEGGRSGTRRERIRCREEESRAAGSKSADVLLVRLSDNFGQNTNFGHWLPQRAEQGCSVLASFLESQILVSYSNGCWYYCVYLAYLSPTYKAFL